MEFLDHKVIFIINTLIALQQVAADWDWKVARQHLVYEMIYELEGGGQAVYYVSYTYTHPQLPCTNMYMHHTYHILKACKDEIMFNVCGCV